MTPLMWVLLMDQTIDNKEDEVRSELVWCSKRTVAYGKTSEPWLGNYLLGMAFGVVLNGFGEIILDDQLEATQITWMNAHFF